MLTYELDMTGNISIFGNRLKLGEFVENRDGDWYWEQGNYRLGMETLLKIVRFGERLNSGEIVFWDKILKNMKGEIE